MIILKVSAEFITDMFTPGVFSPNKCVQGLPRDCRLANIAFENEMITFYFDDGQEETTTLTATYSAVIPGLETV